MTEMVRLDNLCKVYQTGSVSVAALQDVNITIQAGEFVAIIGHSGSGKSTLLNLLGCLDKPTGGAYYLGGQDVSTMSDDELSEVRNDRIGFVFQSFNLIPWLSAIENIEVPLFYSGMVRSERRPLSRKLGQLVGLAERLHHRPSELSGGQQQRVAIARSMANDPLILLADEPTGNLDTATSKEIMLLIKELHKQGKTMIVVTHEPEIAAQCERVIELKDGRVDSDRKNEGNA